MSEKPPYPSESAAESERTLFDFENILDLSHYLITEQGNLTLFPKGLIES